MSDGGAQWYTFGPFFDSNGVLYTGIKVEVQAVGTANDKTYWTDEAKTANGAHPLVDSDNDGVVGAFFDGDYRFQVTDSADAALDIPIDWDNVHVSADTGTMWEGNNDTSYPSVGNENDWQMAVVRTAGGEIIEWGVSDGTAFRRMGAADSLVSKATTYTALLKDGYILCDASSGAFTVTLPTASGISGKQIIIKKIDSSANAITIDGDGAETIDGSATQSLPSQYDYLSMHSDGSNWVLNSYNFASSTIVTLAGAQTLTGLKTVQGIAGLGIRDRSRGLVITRPSVATVDIDCDEVIMQDGSNYSLATTSVNLTVNIATGGANGLDTGAEASSTWYYLWVIYDKVGDTTAGLISVSSTAPTMPGDYTFKALVGAAYNDSGDDFVDFEQDDNFITYIVPQNLKDGTFSTDAWTAQSVATAVPPTAKRIKCVLGGENSEMCLSHRSDGAGGEYHRHASGTVAHDYGILTTGRKNHATIVIKYASSIYYWVPHADSTLDVIGWEL